MTDIIKCDNKKCPLRKKCWRFLAPDGTRQAYHAPAPDGKGTCEHFINR